MLRTHFCGIPDGGGHHPVQGFTPRTLSHRLRLAADRFEGWFDALTDMASPFYGWFAITLGVGVTFALIVGLVQHWRAP